MAEKSGKNLKFLRENNTKEVLKYLTVHDRASRIGLSKELGLSKMTISNIVSDLIESDYIYETNAQQKALSTGPKPMLLEIRRNRILAIGVYISRNSILCALTDIIGDELYIEEQEITAGDRENGLVKSITDIIGKVLAYDEELNKKIVGIGIAMVGLVDSEKGIFVRSPNFIGDHIIKIREHLEAGFPYPVFVQNDMQATAMSEQIYGIGKSCNNFVYFGVTNGIGTAVISEGKVLTGSRGFAVEAGHMSVDYKGSLCSCGNRGCVELYASIPVLLKKTNSSTVEEMLDKYKKKDMETREAFKDFIKAVSVALTNLSNIFDIEKIIIGYEGALFPKSIFKAVEQNINSSCIWRTERRVEIEPSSLKALGPLRGSATIVFQKIYEGQIKLKN